MKQYVLTTVKIEEDEVGSNCQWIKLKNHEELTVPCLEFDFSTLSIGQTHSEVYEDKENNYDILYIALRIK